jgi:hypothetical protein
VLTSGGETTRKEIRDDGAPSFLQAATALRVQRV